LNLHALRHIAITHACLREEKNEAPDAQTGIRRLSKLPVLPIPDHTVQIINQGISLVITLTLSH
jgi:hypothetical protein